MLVNVGLKRFVSASGLGGARRTSTFSLDAMASLVPGHASGSTVPTFTRATTATVTDFEGRLVTVPSGAARFQGARFVYNTLTNVVLSGWTTLGTVSITANQTDPLGGAAAYKLVATGASGGVYKSKSAVGQETDSVWLKGEVGGEQVHFGDNKSSGTVTLTTAWRRYAFVGITVADANFVIQDGGSNATFYAAWPLAEQVTGQSNQNPSEYVSVGVLSAPYHGAGIDGCKWFATENGNTVI